MNTSDCIKQLAKFLSEQGFVFFLSGGILAGLYRRQTRASGIAEFSVEEGSRSSIIDWCSNYQLTLKGMKFPRGGADDDLINDNIAIAQDVVAAYSSPQFPLGLDFVFNSPFLNLAAERKVSLQIDGSQIPVYNPEAFFLSRLVLLTQDKGRYLDEDDLVDIAAREDFIDWAFVLKEIESRHIPLPKVVSHFPPTVRRILERSCRMRA